ncbi:hypothetical protein [Nostoc sp.]|uniref:hypothetical protein n=1 Tax=Nostoc sp. TaxID=1180 RepID=UPI002FF48327
MARRSRWEHLKNEVINFYKEGKTPRELYPMYPNVPPRTIRDWCDSFSPRNPPKSPQDSPDIKTIAPEDVQIISPESPSKLIALDGGERLSDMALARNALRDAVKNPTKPGAAIKIQASFGLMRLTQLRAELPRHIVDETEMTGVEEERDRLKEISLEELQQQYKDAVSG